MNSQASFGVMSSLYRGLQKGASQKCIHGRDNIETGCCGPEGRENELIRLRADMETMGGSMHMGVCVHAHKHTHECLSFHMSICMHFEDRTDGFKP